MALIETLQNLQASKEEIKTSLENKQVSVPTDYKIADVPELIDSIPSGGGEDPTKKWYYYYNRPYSFIDVPEFNHKNYANNGYDEVKVVCNVVKGTKNNFSLRIYPSNTSNIDVYINNVFYKQISVTYSGGVVFQNDSEILNYDNLTHNINDDTRQAIISFKLKTDVYITKISVGDYYSTNTTPCPIVEIYTNGSRANYYTDNIGEGRAPLYLFMNVAEYNSYNTNKYVEISGGLMNYIVKDKIPIYKLQYYRGYKISKLCPISSMTLSTDIGYNYMLRELNFNSNDATGSFTANSSSMTGIQKIDFGGSSYGGNSSVSLLTFTIGKYNKLYTKEAFIETLNSLGANTGGKTRTIAIMSTIYDALTEEEKLIATNKGYTLASIT